MKLVLNCCLKTRMPLLTVWMAIICIPLSTVQRASANDKIKQALQRYEQRIEAERAKVILAFQRETELAERQQNSEGCEWIKEVKQAWMNKELVVSERGGLRFFTGAVESFEAGDFNLSGGFTRKQDALLAENGNATVRLGKPAGSVYFRGIVESKNNFVVQLGSAGIDQSKDIAIIVGGWNNSRSEIHLDNRTIASKPVGMPRRWLCEVTFDNQVVTIFANGAVLMTAKVERALPVNLVNVSVSYDSETTLHSPVLKVK